MFRSNIIQTLFVSNLPPQITDEELETIFARHGRVTRAWLRPSKEAEGPIDNRSANRNDNRNDRNPRNKGPRKSGFVEVHSDDAEQVIWIMNGSWYKTSCIDVMTEADRRKRAKAPRERTVYTAHSY